MLGRYFKFPLLYAGLHAEMLVYIKPAAQTTSRSHGAKRAARTSRAHGSRLGACAGFPHVGRVVLAIR